MTICRRIKSILRHHRDTLMHIVRARLIEWRDLLAGKRILIVGLSRLKHFHRSFSILVCWKCFSLRSMTMRMVWNSTMWIISEFFHSTRQIFISVDYNWNFPTHHRCKIWIFASQFTIEMGDVMRNFERSSMNLCNRKFCIALARINEFWLKVFSQRSPYDVL